MSDRITIIAIHDYEALVDHEGQPRSIFEAVNEKFVKCLDRFHQHNSMYVDGVMYSPMLEINARKPFDSSDSVLKKEMITVLYEGLNSILVE
jgi:hypothetical protein